MDKKLVDEIAAELQTALVAEAEKNREHRRAEAALERETVDALDLIELGAAKSASLQKAVAASVVSEEDVIEAMDKEFVARYEADVATADVRAAEAKIRLYATESPAVTNYALPWSPDMVWDLAAQEAVIPESADLCQTCHDNPVCPWIAHAKIIVPDEETVQYPRPDHVWTIYRCEGYVPEVAIVEPMDFKSGIKANGAEILENVLAVAREELAQEAADG